MSRFSDVTYDYVSQTATIGAGLIWDDVYAALEPYGVNVAGGRVSGVGVAGFILGGGKNNVFIDPMPAQDIQDIHGSPTSTVWRLTQCSPLS
jgi:hypothetical protein